MPKNHKTSHELKTYQTIWQYISQEDNVKHFKICCISNGTDEGRCGMAVETM
jgi:hypothetical protein